MALRPAANLAEVDAVPFGPSAGLHSRPSAAARNVLGWLGWPRRCKLANAFVWEYSCKRLKLAQLVGQLGGFLTCAGRVAGLAPPTADFVLVVAGVVARVAVPARPGAGGQATGCGVGAAGVVALA